MRRLARGLGSSHDAARQGFALALAAALARVPEIESLPALDLLDAALEVSKSMKVPTLPSASSLLVDKGGLPFCKYTKCLCRGLGAA